MSKHKRRCNRASNYRSMNKKLEDNFIDIDGKLNYRTIQELKRRMQETGFHRIKDKETKEYYNEKITDSQLSYADRYLREHGYRQELITNYHVIVTKRRKDIKVANKNVTYKNKKYRKGQYLPKDYD